MIGNSTSPTITAVVDQVHIASGSWTGSDAAGTLILKKYTGTSFFGSTSMSCRSWIVFCRNQMRDRRSRIMYRRNGRIGCRNRRNCRRN